MRDFLLIMSGWLAVTAFATTVVVPWAVTALNIRGRPRRRFMAFHLMLGIAVLLVATAHGALPIEAAGIFALERPALALGSSALVLLPLQIALGISLRGARSSRARLRGAHLATMLALAGLILMHVLVIRGK